MQLQALTVTARGPSTSVGLTWCVPPPKATRTVCAHLCKHRHSCAIHRDDTQFGMMVLSSTWPTLKRSAYGNVYLQVLTNDSLMSDYTALLRCNTRHNSFTHSQDTRTLALDPLISPHSRIGCPRSSRSAEERPSHHGGGCKW